MRDGFELDARWRLMMGFPPSDEKEEALAIVATLLATEGVPYAIIGGIAVQAWTEEPRTTKDIDVALRSFTDVPRAALEAAGFVHTGRYPFSDNWRAPGKGFLKSRTAVQFSAEHPSLTAAIEGAETHQMPGRGVDVRVADVKDLIILKVEAALEPRRRRSKRTSDLGDIERLLEEHPHVKDQIQDWRQILSSVRKHILSDE